jgi:acyl-CoA synthetase (AMP-forming)/AMP-acid ligase II
MAETTLFVSGVGVEEPPFIGGFNAEDLKRGRVSEVGVGGGARRELTACGRPGLDTVVRIVNPETAVECEPGEVGEIWVASPSVAQGYWGKDELTAATFHARIGGSGEGPFLRTGDLGFMVRGQIYVAGRSKDLIIIDGANHYPQDIERTIEQYVNGVKTGCCAAVSVDVEGREELVVVAELDAVGAEGAEAEHERVRSMLRAAVSREHDLRVHDVLLISERIPKTTSGKIQRHLCKKLYLESRATEKAAEARA